jgi:hypothetical protein
MGQDLSRVECHWFPQVRAMGVQVGFRARKGNNPDGTASGSGDSWRRTEVSRSSVTSRVHSPRHFPCARYPTVTVALDAGGMFTQRGHSRI